MNQRDATKEMYFYLSRKVNQVLEDYRGAAKINGATDGQINKAILTIVEQTSKKAW